MGLFGFGKSKEKKEEDQKLKREQRRIKKNITKKEEISLKVLEADKKDIGKQVVRIDYDSMAELDIDDRSVIEIKGNRITVATCSPLHSFDEGKGIVRIDEVIINNSETSIGDTVTVRKIKADAAEQVIVEPTEVIPPIAEVYLANALKNVPVIKGDNVRVPYFGEHLTFQVIGVTPDTGPVLITKKTVFHIEENSTIVQDNLPKVLEAYARDVGIGVARIDPNLMEELYIHRDDVVEIKGKRTTVATCNPLFPSDEGKGIIRMDRYTRNNAEAPIDSGVVIRKVRTKNADKIILRELEENPPINPGYIADEYKGRYVMIGDFVYVNYFGKFVAFQVVDSSPSGDALKITEKTNFHLSNDQSGIGTRYDLELHDSKDPVLRGDIQYNCKLYSDAYSSYDEALASNDNNTFALHGKALCMFHLKEYSESLNLYDRILSHIKEKRTIESYKKNQFEKEVKWIVSVLIDDMKYKEALDYLDIYCKIEMPDESSLMDRGFVLVKFERNREALECFEQALLLNPQNPDLWNNKGIVLKKLGRDDEAVQCFAKAKELEEKE